MRLRSAKKKEASKEDAPHTTRSSDQNALPPSNQSDRDTLQITAKTKLLPGEIINNVYLPPTKIIKKKTEVINKPRKTTRQQLDEKDNRHVYQFLRKNTQDLMSTLTPEVRHAFEILFDRIDVSDSGGLTFKEIKRCVHKHANINLTTEEVNQVLQDLDLKGTGDIEFDEFIFMLSQPENYVRLLDKNDIKQILATPGLPKRTQLMLKEGLKVHAKKETSTDIFFRALKNATKHDSLTVLRAFYRNKLRKLNDHVIHDWSAGQRCIGLSDQEMVKRYEAIQGELLRQRVSFCKDNSYRSSPYARPLEWGLLTLRQAIESRRIQHARPISPVKIAERRVKMSEFVVTPKAVVLPKYVTPRRSPLKRTFNYDQLADIREKVDSIANSYYSELKNVARESSKIVKNEIAADEIKMETSRKNFNLTFKAYCTPFVVSPWIPMPSPTLQASFTPLGKSKLAAQKMY